MAELAKDSIDLGIIVEDPETALKFYRSAPMDKRIRLRYDQHVSCHAGQKNSRSLCIHAKHARVVA